GAVELPYRNCAPGFSSNTRQRWLRDEKRLRHFPRAKRTTVVPRDRVFNRMTLPLTSPNPSVVCFARARLVTDAADEVLTLKVRLPCHAELRSVGMLKVAEVPK